MSDSREIRTMRAQAWERAKGELCSLLQTYWEDEEKHRKMQEEINLFIERVEANGCAE